MNGFTNVTGYIEYVQPKLGSQYSIYLKWREIKSDSLMDGSVTAY
jgi:hypothetical protein